MFEHLTYNCTLGSIGSIKLVLKAHCVFINNITGFHILILDCVKNNLYIILYKQTAVYSL